MKVRTVEEDNNTLLARLDERTAQIQKDTAGLRDEVKLMSGNFSEKIKISESRLEKRIDDLEADLEENYATKKEFNTVQLIVFGFVGVVMLAVIGAMLSQVIIK